MMFNIYELASNKIIRQIYIQQEIFKNEYIVLMK